MSVVQLKANIDPSYYRMLYGQERGQLADMFQARRPSVEERLAAGKALREKVPRSSHGDYDKGADRPDPVAILEKQNVERVQKLIPVRYARMLVSPFTFLRGSAAVMASDLSRTPISGLAVGACGDMHVANFGVYASAERNLVFAINNFDEIHPGPWEWDLKRLAASAAVAARFMGGDKAAAGESASTCVASYRRRMRGYAEMGYLEIWYDTIDEREMLYALSPRVRRNAERTIAKARAKGHIRSLDKLTEQVNGEPRIVEDVPLIVRETHTEKGTPLRDVLNEMLAAYVRQLADMKGSASFAEGDDKNIPNFIEYYGLCGWALALAHAKTGDPAMIAGYCGNSGALDDAIARFALAYAKQTEQDHGALDKARRAGRIKVAASSVV